MSGSRAWMVRAGNDNELIDQFSEQDWIAIGWSEMGNLSELNSREAVKSKYQDEHPKQSPHKVGVNGGQLHRFTNIIDQGDLILSYDKSVREYLVGTVTGPYEYKPEDVIEDYPHIRRIEWVDQIDRDEFSRPARNTLGSTLTVFSLDDIREEIEEIRSGTRRTDEPETSEEGGEDQPPFHKDVESRADELISDHIAHIDAEEMEDLTAALLEAMGYHAQTTEAGADHGIDVEAHPDSLGFEDPAVLNRC
ncbi:restriction endonuclease [Haloarcula marismortui]|uniref:Restriction endonuclease n=3 Tax=Haloarcula marismortui TaxID=2238 RepID=A0A8T8KIV9_9EURY|nr:restriction endonuclease [Haloarcula sinaiiensis]QUJ73837.1 restriction endonuclease [Haloarcula sinaiiensis ATCC 33800]